jgi:heme exporter protein B
MKRLSTLGAVRWLVWRETTLAWRRRSDIVATLFFFIVAVSLFPLSVGPETSLLRSIAPGVVWVVALVACTMSLNRLFAEDHSDGTLEQLVLSLNPTASIIFGKVFAQWLMTAVPLVLMAPLMGVQFGLTVETPLVLMASLALGTPLVLLFGSIGAALTLGLRGAATLTPLLVMPLYIPALIFGSGAVHAVLAGTSPEPHMRLLTAMLILGLVMAPWVTAAALRIALE